MKLSLSSSSRSVSSVPFAVLAAGLVALAPSLAHADDAPATTVSFVSGQFGDHVEQGKPAGDTTAIFTAKKAVYGVDVANGGEPTTVTLVWTLDGKEVQRQSLDVGRSPHWHTWGMRPLGDAKKVDVEILDASGHSLKTDTVSGS